jgi:hypothetical protein
MEEILKQITETVEGYEVRFIKYNPLDNIAIFMVREPYNNPKINDGFVCIQYRKNGYPTNRNKGRKDLILKMPI